MSVTKLELLQDSKMGVIPKARSCRRRIGANDIGVGEHNTCRRMPAECLLRYLHSEIAFSKFLVMPRLLSLTSIRTGKETARANA